MSQLRFEASLAARTAREQSPYWGKHVARYAIAAPQVAGCRVLDIACGTGYGMSFIQGCAQSVIGVDIDLNAARKAQTEISSGNACVMVADGCRLPFSDKSFDVITSFETLEHLEDRPLFLSELKRVLKEQGGCILSTPNANYTMPVDGKPTNPYHVFEYTPEQLLAELKSHLDVLSLLGQTLGANFTIPPFWDAQQRLLRTLKIQLQLFLWRLMNKLPIPMREGLSRALWNHSFYPSEADYQFSNTTIEKAPVLVAVCHKKDG